VSKYKKRTPRTPKICCLPDCSKPRWASGRCGFHSAELQRTDPIEFERLGLLIHENAEEAEHEFYLTKNRLPDPKWTYEVSEPQTAELIRVYGRDTKHHVKVGAFRPAPQIEEENDKS
jgi:hypothetical protein